MVFFNKKFYDLEELKNIDTYNYEKEMDKLMTLSKFKKYIKS